MEELAQWLKSQHKGLRTEMTFQQKVLELASKGRRDSALYHLLAMLVGRFIDAYDERPLTLDLADEAHKRLIVVSDKAVHFNSMSADDRIDLLNEIAAMDLA